MTEWRPFHLGRWLLSWRLQRKLFAIYLDSVQQSKSALE